MYLVQVHEDSVQYHSHSLLSGNNVAAAVKASTYPPTLSFVAVYDRDLKWNGSGRQDLVKIHIDGTTEGALCFSSVVYEEKGVWGVLICGSDF